MATEVSDTPFWINFFTKAGIPAGDAAHYAIMFSDNRITKDMLLDLSKEYLTDMGIVRLGDVISILKHAKQVHQEEAKNRLLKSPSLISISNPSVNYANRRSTAASRMVNHFTSKHPEAAPMSQQPLPKHFSPDSSQLNQSKRKVSVFERLGEEEMNADLSYSFQKDSSPSLLADSVFNRLGGKSDCAKNSGSGSLPYVGVLKCTASPSPSKKIKADISPAKDIQIKKTIKVSPPIDSSKANIQRPEISTTTEGVLSDNAKRESLSLKDRLGSKRDTVISNSACCTTVTKERAKESEVQAQPGGNQKDSSSSLISLTQFVSSTQERASKNQDVNSKTMEVLIKPPGVFSRLGKKSQN